MRLLEEWCNSFATMIQDLPPRVSAVFRSIRRESILQFGDDSPIAFAVFFLRFVCPCIIDPSKFGIMKNLKAEQSHKLLTFSKFLLEVVKAKFECAVSMATDSSKATVDSGATNDDIRDRIRAAHQQLSSSFNNAIVKDQEMFEEQHDAWKETDPSVQEAILSIATFLSSVGKDRVRRALRSNRAPQQLVVDITSPLEAPSKGTHVLAKPSRHFSLPEGKLDTVLQEKMESASFSRDRTSHPSLWAPEVLQCWLVQQNIPQQAVQCMRVTGHQFLELNQNDLAAMGVSALGYQKKLLRAQCSLQEKCDNWKPGCGLQFRCNSSVHNRTQPHLEIANVHEMVTDQWPLRVSIYVSVFVGSW